MDRYRNYNTDGRFVQPPGGRQPLTFARRLTWEILRFAQNDSLIFACHPEGAARRFSHHMHLPEAPSVREATADFRPPSDVGDSSLRSE